MTFEQIDKRAEELFRECGGLPIEWGAVDECTRMYYRKMAEQEGKVVIEPIPIYEPTGDAWVMIEAGAMPRRYMTKDDVLEKYPSTPPADSTRSIPPADASAQGQSQWTEAEARSRAPKE
jgi:hypothetical protein